MAGTTMAQGRPGAARGGQGVSRAREQGRQLPAPLSGAGHHVHGCVRFIGLQAFVDAHYKSAERGASCPPCRAPAAAAAAAAKHKLNRTGPVARKVAPSVLRCVATPLQHCAAASSPRYRVRAPPPWPSVLLRRLAAPRLAGQALLALEGSEAAPAGTSAPPSPPLPPPARAQAA